MSELPKGWVETTMDQLSVVTSGIGFPKHFQGLDTKEIPVYKVGDISRSVQGGEKHLTTSEFYVDTATQLLIKGKLFPEGTTLFAKIGEALRLNRRGFIGKKGLADNNVMAVIPDDLANKKFIFYYLNTIDFAKYSRSSTVPSIRKGDVESLVMDLPPLAEQKRIVEKLDQVLAQVDTIKARLDGIPAILKRFRQSVLAAAVSGKLTEEWRGNTPFSAPKNIGSLITDIRYGTSKKCSETSGRVPVLRIPNIGNGQVLLDNLKYADFDDKELKNLALKEGDLLLIRSNGSVDLVGKLAVISSQNLHCLFAGYLIRLRFDVGLVNPKFVALGLQSPSLRQVIELKAKSTSGVNNINTKEISSLEIPVPSFEEQTEIVRLVDQYFAFADTIEKQVQKAQQRVDKLTQSILAKAFRGELVPQDPTDEPADELLKRIATARAESEAFALSAKKTAKKVGKKTTK